MGVGTFPEGAIVGLELTWLPSIPSIWNLCVCMDMHRAPVCFLAMVHHGGLGMSMVGHGGGEGEQLRVSLRACAT